MGKKLPILGEEKNTGDDMRVLSARWPESVLLLSDEERALRVREGSDTVIYDDENDGKKRRRGFIRAVLRVPIGHPKAVVYGVFVEVDRASYIRLQNAHASKAPIRVWGTLATKLPYLEGAYGSGVEIVEDGSELRARVVSARHEALLHGPTIGPKKVTAQ